MTTHLAKAGDFKVAIDTWTRENQMPASKDKGGSGQKNSLSQPATNGSRDRDIAGLQPVLQLTRRGSVEILSPPLRSGEDGDSGPRRSQPSVTPACFMACFGRRSAAGARHQVVPETAHAGRLPSVKGIAGGSGPHGANGGNSRLLPNEKSPGRRVAGM